MIHSVLVLLLLFSPVQSPQSSAKDHFDSGIALLQKQDIAGAINEMTKAIDLNPRFVEALFVRGQCFFVTGDQDKALLDYDKVIELAPNLAEIVLVYNNRGVIRMAKGDNEGAAKDFETAIHIRPNHAASYSNRAVLRDRLGDRTGAASDYDKALHLNPNLPAAYISRGILRFEGDDLKGALEDFNRAIELVPNSALVPRASAAKTLSSRATIYILVGEIDLAIADMRNAISQDASSVSDKDPGINSSPFQRLQSFIVSHPTNARAYEARGLFRLAQRRQRDANEDFKKSLELDPKLRPEIDRLLKITF